MEDSVLQKERPPGQTGTIIDLITFSVGAETRRHNKHPLVNKREEQEEGKSQATGLDLIRSRYHTEGSCYTAVRFIAQRGNVSPAFHLGEKQGEEGGKKYPSKV
ncbi:hypothetical protein F7725_008638 [Dissostichus mawsoni]|uniref:Uncharacterized protein n=1 Tax=Dissostichus mawsoni TaxID=36200 RepID=A0A7J5Y7R4_DISMA|nr:hypothetical protein F7725_008638 [Dissostichus mawsoni]